ncbi:MAG: methyl-accepting chemotaxis protein [Acetobacterium sp.]|nr:methyl-accepting chemotaxis protein [Acetobacterium sp.]
MKKSMSLLSKLLITIGVPIAVLFFGITLVAVYVDQMALIITSGIGVIILLGILIAVVKPISCTITQLDEITERLAQGDTEIQTDSDRKISVDQLNNDFNNCIKTAENIKMKAIIAKKLADGEMNNEVTPVTERDSLGIHLKAISDTIKNIGADINQISEINSGSVFDFDTHDLFCGDLRMAMENLKRILNHAADKLFWYESALDAIPYNIHLLDKNGIELFMNKAYENKMISIGFIKNRESAYGTKSCGKNIEVCNTDGCAEDCTLRLLLNRGLTENAYEYGGSYSKINTEHIKNKDGQNIGFLEMSLDLTPSMSVNAYTKTEVSRLEKNLLNLAQGNLNFDMEIEAPNTYTAEISEQFNGIGKSLEAVKESIGNLIDDATMLTNAAVKGNLLARGDESKFNGSWKILISGMHNILEEIERPLAEVAEVITGISGGNLKAAVYGQYEGKFDELKQSVNNLGSRFTGMIGEISTITNQIGNGNLDIENIQAYHGDFANISNALNTIIETLNDLLGDINLAAEQVNSGANQVSDGSQSLAQGSTEQASSVQELTASIVEIAEQTKNNAVDANKAKELAAAVMEYAVKGNHHMTEMQTSMTEINQSSKDISKIIKVIDDIAFQTNILALNAAVEAARAGQQGKGFAVVAEEVRTLAARSADAAKGTTALIEGSINKVQTGTRIADETANALREIVDGIKKTSDLVGNIATASNEQATNITQVNVGIDQVAQVVQHNSATAEESAAASEELSSQAEMLKAMINQFKLRKR